MENIWDPMDKVPVSSASGQRPELVRYSTPSQEAGFLFDPEHTAPRIKVDDRLWPMSCHIICKLVSQAHTDHRRLAEADAMASGQFRGHNRTYASWFSLGLGCEQGLCFACQRFYE